MSQDPKIERADIKTWCLKLQGESRRKNFQQIRAKIAKAAKDAKKTNSKMIFLALLASLAFLAQE